MEEVEAAGYWSREKSNFAYRGPLPCTLARSEVRAIGGASRATCRAVELVADFASLAGMD